MKKKWMHIILTVVMLSFFITVISFAKEKKPDNLEKEIGYGPLSMYVPKDYIVVSDLITYAANPDYCDRVDDVLFFHDTGFISDSGEELFNIYKKKFHTLTEETFVEEELYQRGYLCGTMAADDLYTRNTLKRGSARETGEYQVKCYFYFYKAEVYLAILRSDGSDSRLEEYEETVIFQP